MLESLTDNELQHLYQMRKKLGGTSISKRLSLVEKFNYDVKFAAHALRLLNQAEQIMIEGDLDLERNREQIKAIRRGDWTMEEVIEYVNRKERDLETVYSNSTLRHSPDEQKIKTLLLNCLEMHFGSLDKCVVIQSDVQQMIADLELIIHKYKGSG